MAQFYTLEEAARALGMNPEELKSKAQRREVRAFLDSGSWRFRTSDIDELARRRGMGSDPDLSLSDIDLLPDQSGEADAGSFDEQSVFQLGVARSDLGPASMESIPAQESGSDADILLDDASLPMGGGSSSHIIGMESHGKRPTDSDVTLVPEGPKGASDSDVSLSGEIGAIGRGTPAGPGDSDVTLVQEGSDESFEAFGTMDYEGSSSAFSGNLGLDSSSGSGINLADTGGSSAEHGSDETTLRPSPLGLDDFDAEPEGISADDEDSDFELTPSSVIDALQPESGSDFELTALDGSDEFEAVAPRPSDSDVTGAEPSTSGVNLSKPSDSGINLMQMGGLGDADSIELAPLEDEDSPPAKKAKPAPKPSAGKPGPAASPVPPAGMDPSATALPVGPQKDIFEDTDFEVDALDTGDDQTMQLDANSDFDLDESESASEVFALDEEDVDQNAATAMGPAVLEDEEAISGAMDAVASESDEMGQVDWDEEVAPSGSAASAAVAAAPAAGRRGGILLADAGGPPWSGIWVGVLGVTTVLMMALAFITMDVVRNLNSYQGDVPVASGLVKMVAGGE